MHISTRSHLFRRTLLKGACATIGLPLLEAMMPAFTRAEATKKVPRRLVAIQTNMGIIPQYFFPEQAGSDYALTPYLEKIAAHRKQMTIFSGASHLGVTGGHAAEKCFLTATPHPDRGGFRNTVSLDQYAAEHIGNETRFPSLSLACSNEGGPTLSYTRSGAPVAPDKSPRKLFEKLFVQGSSKDIEANVDALRQGRSMLDFVGEESKRLSRTLSKGDQHRLDQYFTSVRELENRMTSAEAWEYRPKPVVNAKAPDDIDDAKEFVKRTKLTLDVVKLALENDSTRLVSLFIDTGVIHGITHHGNRPEALTELSAHESAQFGALNDFLTALTNSKEDDGSLLDRTMVLYGTCMGSASAHSNVNLPTLLAGGGFKHGQHLAFDKVNNYPLTNLYVSILQRLGIETNRFSTANATMKGLEMV
jgi:hypothetical protein